MTPIKQLSEEAAREWLSTYIPGDPERPALSDIIARALEKQREEFEAEHAKLVERLDAFTSRLANAVLRERDLRNAAEQAKAARDRAVAETVERCCVEVVRTCQACGGTGGSITTTTVCCNRPNESGECCNNPIPNQQQEQCPYCGTTIDAIRSLAPKVEKEATDMASVPRERCSQCALTRDERVAYTDGCPMRCPEHGCPFYDQRSRAAAGAKE